MAIGRVCLSRSLLSSVFAKGFFSLFHIVQRDFAGLYQVSHHKFAAACEQCLIDGDVLWRGVGRECFKKSGQRLHLSFYREIFRGMPGKDPSGKIIG
jgi:hypothetical protein